MYDSEHPIRRTNPRMIESNFPRLCIISMTYLTHATLVEGLPSIIHLTKMAKIPNIFRHLDEYIMVKSFLQHTPKLRIHL
jgi:hypothetical protein